MKTRNLIVRMFPLVMAALLTGCQGAETSKITRQNLEKIKQGMTKAQVLAILGEPTGTASSGPEKDRGLVWQGRSLRIIAGFDGNGKLSGMLPALLTPR